MTLDDPEFLAKRSAYIDTIRTMGRPLRMAGFVAILVGVGLLLWARTNTALPAWTSWIAYGLLGAGWVAFIYVVVQRSRWVRANPFDPNL